jgi:hypothetical protein
MALIDREVRLFIDSRHLRADTVDNHGTIKNEIKLFYRNQMTSSYKQEELQLRRIVSNNVQPTDIAAKLKLNIYYNNMKLSSLLIKNNSHAKPIFGVVYRYSCDHELCQQTQTYIGYTETTLKERMTAHANRGSIKEHHSSVHNYKISTAEILRSVKVITKRSSKRELMIAEALCIKDEKPSINIQREDGVRMLKIF